MKTILTGLVLTCTVITLFAQNAIIQNTNLQIHASLNNEPLAWASNYAEVSVNTATGDFLAKILTDDLYIAKSNPGFSGPSEENRGKYLTLTGRIPVYEVDRTNSIINLQVELMANFNDIDYPTIFTFSIIAMNPGGFSVQAKGAISHSALEIDNLRDLEDELIVWLSFTGR